MKVGSKTIVEIVIEPVSTAWASVQITRNKNTIIFEAKYVHVDTILVALQEIMGFVVREEEIE